MRFTTTVLAALFVSTCSAWVIPGYERLKSMTLLFDPAHAAQGVVDAVFDTGGQDANADTDPQLSVSCLNSGRLRQRTWADQGCDPDRHQSFQSSHNCANANGAAYFCYLGGENYVCLRGANLMRRAQYENGECFR
ncbi:hypothetical protein EIP91_006751 [Steccherinum ochraceum]|uniref:Uncharacterized protein n=1 Tax=Steccherinum ochraceum TaxID=92696 RepID=A0A4R0R7S6_9APHY|nr:hypothetical protein EIP91_006751 [Steccherinum ochraceum]